MKDCEPASRARRFCEYKECAAFRTTKKILLLLKTSCFSLQQASLPYQDIG